MARARERAELRHKQPEDDRSSKATREAQTSDSDKLDASISSDADGSSGPGKHEEGLLSSDQLEDESEAESYSGSGSEDDDELGVGSDGTVNLSSDDLVTDRKRSHRKSDGSGRTLRHTMTEKAVVQANSNIWYQAYFVKQSANEVKMRFPETSEDSSSEEAKAAGSHDQGAPRDGSHYSSGQQQGGGRPAATATEDEAMSPRPAGPTQPQSSFGWADTPVLGSSNKQQAATSSRPGAAVVTRDASQGRLAASSRPAPSPGSGAGSGPMLGVGSGLSPAPVPAAKLSGTTAAGAMAAGSGLSTGSGPPNGTGSVGAGPGAGTGHRKRDRQGNGMPSPSIPHPLAPAGMSASKARTTPGIATVLVPGLNEASKQPGLRPGAAQVTTSGAGRAFQPSQAKRLAKSAIADPAKTAAEQPKDNSSGKSSDMAALTNKVSKRTKAGVRHGAATDDTASVEHVCKPAMKQEDWVSANTGPAGLPPVPVPGASATLAGNADSSVGAEAAGAGAVRPSAGQALAPGYTPGDTSQAARRAAATQHPHADMNCQAVGPGRGPAGVSQVLVTQPVQPERSGPDGSTTQSPARHGVDSPAALADQGSARHSPMDVVQSHGTAQPAQGPVGGAAHHSPCHQPTASSSQPVDAAHTGAAGAVARQLGEAGVGMLTTNLLIHSSSSFLAADPLAAWFEVHFQTLAQAGTLDLVAGRSHESGSLPPGFVYNSSFRTVARQLAPPPPPTLPPEPAVAGEGQCLSPAVSQLGHHPQDAGPQCVDTPQLAVAAGAADGAAPTPATGRPMVAAANASAAGTVQAKAPAGAVPQPSSIVMPETSPTTCLPASVVLEAGGAGRQGWDTTGVCTAQDSSRKLQLGPGAVPASLPAGKLAAEPASRGAGAATQQQQKSSSLGKACAVAGRELDNCEPNRNEEDGKGRQAVAVQQVQQQQQQPQPPGLTPPGTAAGGPGLSPASQRPGTGRPPSGRDLLPSSSASKLTPGAPPGPGQLHGGAAVSPACAAQPADQPGAAIEKPSQSRQAEADGQQQPRPATTMVGNSRPCAAVVVTNSPTPTAALQVGRGSSSLVHGSSPCAATGSSSAARAAVSPPAAAAAAAHPLVSSTTLSVPAAPPPPQQQQSSSSNSQREAGAAAAAAASGNARAGLGLSSKAVLPPPAAASIALPLVPTPAAAALPHLPSNGRQGATLSPSRTAMQPAVVPDLSRQAASHSSSAKTPPGTAPAATLPAAEGARLPPPPQLHPTVSASQAVVSGLQAARDPRSGTGQQGAVTSRDSSQPAPHGATSTGSAEQPLEQGQQWEQAQQGPVARRPPGATGFTPALPHRHLTHQQQHQHHQQQQQQQQPAPAVSTILYPPPPPPPASMHTPQLHYTQQPPPHPHNHASMMQGAPSLGAGQAGQARPQQGPGPSQPSAPPPTTSQGPQFVHGVRVENLSQSSATSGGGGGLGGAGEGIGQGMGQGMVIKVPEGAVLRGCKKTRRKLREHLRLRAEIHSQLRFIASLLVLRVFLTCLVGYPTPGFPSAPQPPAVQPPQPPDAPPLPPLPPRAPAQPAPAQPASMELDTDSDSESDCDSEPEPQSDSESESEPETVRQPPQRRCSARLAALAPAAPTGPPLPLDCEDPLMLRQLKDFCKFFANPNF
ncbi:hypothetical protein QJQ45_011697 [Haematococcus lacustris]|nr:hypothetical protein QJQ45_011697 [Haematococcus lacustris]